MSADLEAADSNPQFWEHSSREEMSADPEADVQKQQSVLSIVSFNNAYFGVCNA